MKVLVMTVVHDPDDARIRFREIPALLRAGHSVVYAAPFSSYGRVPPDGVEAVDLPRSYGRHRATALGSAFRAMRRIASSVDLVLVHDSELLPLLMRVSGPARVWDVHEDTAGAIPMKEWIPRPVRSTAAFVVRRLESWADRRAHLLLAEPSYAERFRRPHPIVVNDVDVPAVVSPPGDDRVVYLGQLTRARGVEELISLAEALRGEVHLEVAGNASSDVRPALKAAHAQGLLSWHGFVATPRVQQLLDGALAGLSLLHDQPNYRHSRPTKIIDYMAHGVPVITTPLPQAAAVVERHACGIIVPFLDVDAATDAVRRLRSDEGMRTTMARNGHAAARAHYDWKRTADVFVTALEEAVAGRR